MQEKLKYLLIVSFVAFGVSTINVYADDQNLVAKLKSGAELTQSDEEEIEKVLERVNKKLNNRQQLTPDEVYIADHAPLGHQDSSSSGW